MPPTNQFSPKVEKYLHKLAQKLLTKPQQRHLIKFVMALIISTVRRTLTNQAQCFGYHRHASCVTRFITEASWDEQLLMRRHQHHMMQLIAAQPRHEPIQLLIDDTATVKYGRHMESLSRHYCDGKIRHGHCKVTLFVCCGNLKVPYDSRLYVTKATAAAQGLEFHSKIALARQMLEDFQPPPGREVMVLFDSFYTSRALLKYLHFQRGWKFLCRIESNRTVGWKRRQRSVTELAGLQPTDDWPLLGVDSHSYVGRKFTVGLWCSIPGSLVLCADAEQPGKVHYYITNQRSLSATSVVRLYQRRWCIETYHRDVKQLLGLAHYQLRCRRGLLRFWLLVDVAYCVLRLQTCWEADNHCEPASLPTLGQLRKAVQIEQERQKLRMLLEIFEQTGDCEAVYRAAGCL